MLNYIKEQIDLWKFKRTPLALAIRSHTQHYFHGGTLLTSFKQENKDKIVADYCQRISLILQAPNPVMACREALAEYTLLYAQIQVHSLKENEKAEMFYSDNPYISGQLWRHIGETSDHNDELAQFKFENPALTSDDLIDVANTRCALYLYYANGLNIVRMELGDKNAEKDWFRPFVEACLVNAEHRLREASNLPPLVPGLIGSLAYAVFLNYVLNGEQNPFFKWVRDFPDEYLAGEGPLPKLATKNA